MILARALGAAVLMIMTLAIGKAVAQQQDGVTVIPLDPPAEDPYESLLDDDPFAGTLEDSFDDPFLVPERDLSPEIEERRDQVESAAGGVVRGLDKLTGRVGDVALARGETQAFGRIRITMNDCRFPVENPAGDAYAYLEIRDRDAEETVFAGWMVASSPALNPMEHPRYDVWVLRCNN